MKKIILFLSIFLVLAAAVSASVTVSDSYIDTEYIAESFISGWIKMSIENEPMTSMVSDTEKTTLKLIDFLERIGINYKCSVEECKSDYSSDGEITESFYLGVGQKKVFGLEYSGGDIKEISEISFDITSDAGDSQYNQLKIDILEDGTYETGNSKQSAVISSIVNWGCFTDEARLSPREVSLDNIFPYCQRIKIKESPGLKIGAWVKKISANNNIVMNLYSTNGDNLSECSVPASEVGDGSFVSCEVDYLITKEKEYYVCIKKESSEGDYLIRASKLSGASNICGLHDYPATSDDGAAYEIGIVQKKFGPVGTISVSNDLESGETISSLVKGYIEDKYNNNCQNENPCYVPIKIQSMAPQNITITSVISKYKSEQWDLVESEVYALSEKPSTLSVESTNITIDNIFEVKDEAGSREYKIIIGTETISFDKKINIKAGKFKLFPEIAVSGTPTEFRIISDVNETMKGYVWKFGDGSPSEETTISSAMHTYDGIGEYTLIVDITDSNDNKISKSFNISVSSAKNLVDSELSRMKSRLASISSVMKLSLTEYEKTKLLESVNIDSLLESVNKIESELGENPTPEKYGVAFDDLLLLDVPNELIRTDFESVPFFPLIGEVDVEVIKDITQEIDAKGTDEGIRNAVILWSKNSIKVSIQKSEMSLNWKNQDELLLKTFKLDLTPRIPIEEYYLIFDSGTLSSDDANVVVGINGKSYIKIPGKRKSVNLFTQVGISFSELPIVVSPRISDLSIVDIEIKEADKPMNKPMWIFVGILFAILIGFIIYLGLKYWYRTKYERHLFKDRNILYNVMLYVNKQIREGTPVSDIRESLKKSGWSSEQIRYILRKYEGRETGMPGLGFGSDKIKAPPVQENFNKNMFQDRKYKP